MHSVQAPLVAQSSSCLYRCEPPGSRDSCSSVKSSVIRSSALATRAPVVSCLSVGSKLEVSQRWRPQGLGFRLRKKRLSWKARSQADTEAGSIEDLNLEELDEQQLDEFFETYGEIVKADSDSSPTSEVDDDAESLALAVALAEVAHEVKAGQIRVLCVKPLVYWTRFFVIATGFSRPQVDAIGKRMRDLAEERYKRTVRGDLKPNSWTLLDFGDVVVHLFYPREREYYNLEEFYGNAIPVELPFESQTQMI